MSSKPEEIKIKIEAEVLAEYEGLVVLGTKINGRYSKGLLCINLDDFDSNDC